MFNANQVRKTRFAELGYVEVISGLWRLVDLQSPDADGLFRVIGPYYKTRQELLADLDRYAAVYGCA